MGIRLIETEMKLSNTLIFDVIVLVNCKYLKYTQRWLRLFSTCSSRTIASSRKVPPTPPFSAGNDVPRNPILPSSCHISLET